MRKLPLACALVISLLAATSWGGSGDQAAGTHASKIGSKAPTATIELVYENGVERFRAVEKASPQQARRHGGGCSERAVPDL